MARKRRTAAHREAICEAQGWICHLCGLPVDPRRDRWELDHRIALAAGGSDDDSNLSPAHSKCHLEKTVGDVAKIAKGKRVRAKLMGTQRQASRPMPGSKRSQWKKHLDGMVTRR